MNPNIFDYFQSSQSPLVLFLPFTVFDLILKGFALWKAAKSDQRNWFIALLIVNSIGILPLIYLKFFQKKKKK